MLHNAPVHLERPRAFDADPHVLCRRDVHPFCAGMNDRVAMIGENVKLLDAFIADG